MKKILESASKVVLISMTLGLISMVFNGNIEGKDYIPLISLVFGYYFGKNSKDSPPTPAL